MIKMPGTNQSFKIGVGLLSLLVSLLLWPNFANATSHIRFEFINLEDSQQQESFPFNTRNEIIVASDDVDIRILLPIELRFRYDTKDLKTTIPADPQQFCRGPTGCSREGPVIGQPEGGYVEITAIDKGGNVITHYQTGTPPPREQSPSPSPTPTLSPSPIPSPIDSEVEVEKTQVQDAGQQILSNRNIGILLILIALALIVFATTSGHCPDLCTEGDCQDCQLASIRIAVSGTEPGEIEELLESLDLLEWFRWIPGATPGGKELMPEIVKKAKKIGERFRKLGMQINGVDVYATISYEECKRVSCWLIWSQTTWVKAQKEVKIPPGIYRYHDINPEAWRPDHLFNEKKRKQVHDYIEREALKNCPEKCRSI